MENNILQHVSAIQLYQILISVLSASYIFKKRATTERQSPSLLPIFTLSIYPTLGCVYNLPHLHTPLINR